MIIVLGSLFAVLYVGMVAVGLTMVIQQPLFEGRAFDLRLKLVDSNDTLLVSAKPSVTWDTPESLDAVHIPVKNECRVWENTKGLRSFHIEHI